MEKQLPKEYEVYSFYRVYHKPLQSLAFEIYFSIESAKKAIEETGKPEDFDIFEYDKFYCKKENKTLKINVIRYDNKLNFISMKIIDYESQKSYDLIEK